MVGENDRSMFIPIQEYLSLHAVKAQFDSNVDGVVIFVGDLFDSIFDIQLIWQRRNIRRTTYVTGTPRIRPPSAKKPSFKSLAI